MKEQERLNWLRERRTYIGGSDVAGILGLNPYKTPLSVYLEKTSTEFNNDTSQAAQWGNLLEDVIAQEYERRTGVVVEVEENVIRHPEYSFIAANIDRWANNKEYVLECKTTGFMKRSEWGQEFTDQIPDSYLCQVAYYAAICDVPKVDIAVLIGGQDFRIYTYLRNKGFEDKIIKIACNFWHEHVLPQIPPEATHANDILSLYPKSNGLEILADNEALQKVAKLKELKQQSKLLSEESFVIQMDIQKFMKECDTLLDNEGNKIATWRSYAPRTSFDAKRLQEDNKELYTQYCKEINSTRMFLIK